MRVLVLPPSPLPFPSAVLRMKSGPLPAPLSPAAVVLELGVTYEMKGFALAGDKDAGVISNRHVIYCCFIVCRCV